MTDGEQFLEATTAVRPRRWWIAAPLGVLAPVIGYLYVGRARAALAALIFTEITVFSPWMAIGRLLARPIVGPVVFAAIALISVAMFVDIVRSALRARDFMPGRWNRPWIYAIAAAFLVVLGPVSAWLPGLAEDARAVRAFTLMSSSMYPTIRAGEIVLCDMRAYDDAVPAIGDVVVLRRPNEPGVIAVSRIVAGPGSTVAVRDGIPVADARPPTVVDEGPGEVPGERFLSVTAPDGRRWRMASGPGEGYRRNVTPTTLSTDRWFVVGDRTDNAVDSRMFGPIARADLVGRAGWIVWPSAWSRFGRAVD